METIKETVRVNIQDPELGHPQGVSQGDLVYVKGERKFTFIRDVSIDKGTMKTAEISYDDLRSLLLVAQEEKRKKDYVDSEGINHKVLLDDILKFVESQENNVQVLDGGIDTVRMEHFPCDSVTSVMELIHFIQVNELTETRPWSTVWNLYRCMLIAAGK